MFEKLVSGDEEKRQQITAVAPEEVASLGGVSK
jgi:hypothetical protein